MNKQDLTEILQGVINTGTGGEFGSLYLAIGFITGILADPEGNSELIHYCSESKEGASRIRVLHSRLQIILEKASND